MAREFEEIPYKFTKTELDDMGRDLAHANQQIYDLRSEKIATVATMGAAIKAAEKHAADLTQRINQKFEMRRVEVVFLMDKPKVGLKTVIRSDTGEELRVAAMSLEEQQATLNFGERGEERES